jgi:dolichol kinase
MTVGNAALLPAMARAIPLSIATAVIEGLSYRDLDNLAIPFSIAALVHFL